MQPDVWDAKLLTQVIDLAGSTRATNKHKKLCIADPLAYNDDDSKLARLDPRKGQLRILARSLHCSRKVPGFQRCGLCTNNCVALVQATMQFMTGRLVVPEQEFQYMVAKKATFETCRQACCSEASGRFGVDP